MKPDSVPADDVDATGSDESAGERVERIFADAELRPELIGKRSGRRVRLEPDAGGERLLICTAEGEVELSIRLTPQGPVLSLSGARVELRADHLALRCRELEVDVGEHAAIRAKSLTTQVEDEHALAVGGRSHQQARSFDVEATLGNIALRANDDVEVEGERIWLNR